MLGVGVQGNERGREERGRGREGEGGRGGREEGGGEGGGEGGSEGTPQPSAGAGAAILYQIELVPVPMESP